MEKRNKSDLTVCTIVSKNYLPYARVLAESFLEHNDGEVFVLLVDRVDGYFDPEKEKFKLIEIEELRDMVPDFYKFCFQYTILELNTAIKPYVLEYILREYGAKKLIYFDPDIMVTGELGELSSMLDRDSIVLTPHLTEPYNDDRMPTEVDILRSGTYNLGFVAFANTDTSLTHLRWWQERLHDQCLVDPDKGLFVDQKWMDLVPGFYEDGHILHEPGYNVAYWNYHCRDVRMDDRGVITVNGEPSYFLHFSGFNAENIKPVSKYQNRYTIYDLEQMRPVFELYRDKVLEKGWSEIKGWPYHFACFDNGEKIPPFARRMLLYMGEDARKFGNPFSTEEEKSYHDWLNRSFRMRELAQKGLEKTVELTKKVVVPILGRNRKAMEFLVSVNKTLSSAVFRGGAPGRPRSAPLAIDTESIGVNVAGYITSESGTGEAVRANIKALEEAGVKHSLINLDSPYRQKDETHKDFSDDNPYPFNLVQVNADQVLNFLSQRGSRYFEGKYNIGFWFWELSSFPDKWAESFCHFDEIWVASSFCQDSVSRSSPVPVVKMPPAVEVTDIRDVKRSDFGISEDAFVFLYMFDFLSFFERKNPLAVLRAFRKAFGEGDGAVLVIKCTNSERDTAARKQFFKEAEGLNVKLIDEYLDKDELHGLMNLSDCYVSLHRSEGFGLPLAEAMYLGKPVIATAYSGNMEFMDLNNSFPVGYELVEIERDIGPYRKGNVWAEPDVEHAAELMRLVHDDRDRARSVAERGARDIRAKYNPQAAGRRIRQRLERIGASATL